VRDWPFDLQERTGVVRSREISSILDGEHAIRGRRVVVFLVPGSGRVAAIASKRIGGAVQRNRARRILRAAWAEVRPLVGERDAVLVARAAIAGASSRELVTEMAALVTGTAEARA
jgi:ribonuclease P protein component